MASDDVIVLNDGLEQRTSKTGKQRYTIKVSSEPVIFDLDPKRLGAPVAQAIAHHFRERIKGIAARAAPATIKAREVAAKAFAAGKPWAMKRYAGGRTGATAPNQSDRMFNDSGRMEKTITANASSNGAWRVNVAANRLSGDPASVAKIYAKLVELVPEFGNPALLMQNDLLKRTLEKATQGMITKARMQTGKLKVQLVRSILGLASQVGELMAG
jgi:hypothetical protein